MKQDHQNLEESLGYLVGRTHRALVNRLNRNFAEAGHDVTAEQWAILMKLWRQEGVGQQQLAESACKDKTSVTRLIDGLERRRLVLRVSDQADRRNNLIYLTEKGEAVRKELAPVVDKTLAAAQHNANPQHLEICKSMLAQIYFNLARP